MYSEGWKLPLQSSTDIKALLPCALLPRQGRGTHKRQFTKPSVQVAAPPSTQSHLFGPPLDAVGLLVVHLPALARDEDLVAAAARLDHPARPALAHVPLDHVQVPVQVQGI